MANTSGLQPWTKGQSGNPGGRPAGAAALAGYLRERLGEDGRLAADWLLGVWADKERDHKERAWALELILAYAFGRPAQAVAVADVTPTQTTFRVVYQDEEFDTRDGTGPLPIIRERLRAKIEEMASRTPASTTMAQEPPAAIEADPAPPVAAAPVPDEEGVDPISPPESEAEGALPHIDGVRWLNVVERWPR